MQENDDLLIERLKEAVYEDDPLRAETLWVRRPCVRPCVSQKEIDRAESMLGFPLPPLLKRVYLEVGNGGFGPGYGLLSLFPLEVEDPDDEMFIDEDTVVHSTLAFAKYPEEWPHTLLYVANWGCNIYSSIDCSDPMYSVVHSEQTFHYGIEAPSIQSWLQDWANKKESLQSHEDLWHLPPAKFVLKGEK